MIDDPNASKKKRSKLGKIRLIVLFAALAGSASAFAATIYNRIHIPAYGDNPSALRYLDDVDPRTLSADDLTTFRFDGEAYTQEAVNLDWRLSFMFDLGDGFLERPFTPASPMIKGANNDGLGPIFNASSCEGCHEANGRTEPLPGQGYLVRLSVPGTDENGGPNPHPSYGGQFGDQSTQGVPAEGTVIIEYQEIAGRYGDGQPFSLRMPEIRFSDLSYGPIDQKTMTSARAPLSLYGLGLLEAVSDEMLLAMADPDDSDDDGVSGRVNRVWDMENGQTAIGRFGWKAEQPSLITQSADAAANDMGVTSALLPNQMCTDVQDDCAGALHGDDGEGVELSHDGLMQIAAYMQLLAVPGRGYLENPEVVRGEQLFNEVGCAVCHVTELVTGGDHKFRRLRNKKIQPFTDLLLHDMGEGLSDERPSFSASGREWRTPPLWGIGMLETVNGHTNLLHDGRARNFAEAILWHGGEAQRSREAFRTMPADDREAIIKFLKSL